MKISINSPEFLPYWVASNRKNKRNARDEISWTSQWCIDLQITQMIIDSTIQTDFELNYISWIGEISHNYLKLAFHIQRKEILLMHGNVFRNMVYPKIRNKNEQEIWISMINFTFIKMLNEERNQKLLTLWTKKFPSTNGSRHSAQTKQVVHHCLSKKIQVKDDKSKSIIFHYSNYESW